MKKVLSVLLLTFSFFTKAFSQAAVIDVSAIATAIENGITLYKQLETSYNQYKNMIDQLTLIGKDMISFDPRKYDWEQWDTVLKLTDHYMSQMDNIENIINKKTMHIGSLKFSMKDLYTTDFYKNLDSEISEELNPNNVTDYEKAQFYRRHGLSFSHYNKLKALSHELHENAVNTAAKVSVMESADEIIMKQIKDFKEASNDTTGTVDNLQLAAKIQAQNLHEVKEIAITVRALTESMMQFGVIRQTEKEIDDESFRQQLLAPDSPFNSFYKQGGNEANLRGPSSK